MPDDQVKVRDPQPGCPYCGGTGWHQGAVCFCRMLTSEIPDPEAVRRLDAERAGKTTLRLPAAVRLGSAP